MLVSLLSFLYQSQYWPSGVTIYRNRMNHSVKVRNMVPKLPTKKQITGGCAGWAISCTAQKKKKFICKLAYTLSWCIYLRRRRGIRKLTSLISPLPRGKLTYLNGWACNKLTGFVWHNISLSPFSGKPPAHLQEVICYAMYESYPTGKVWDFLTQFVTG